MEGFAAMYTFWFTFGKTKQCQLLLSLLYYYQVIEECTGVKHQVTYLLTYCINFQYTEYASVLVQLYHTTALKSSHDRAEGTA